MKYSFVSQTDSSRLIIFFAGWGMDKNPFTGLALAGYDIVVIWDYTDECLDSEFWDNYSEICIIGWSYGVYFAGRFIERYPCLPITARIAVNGTLFPVDESKGISPELFDATLSAISELSVQKFYRRMCGNSGLLENFLRVAPKRSVESVHSELVSIRDTFHKFGAPVSRWDIAYISENDRIFPANSQYEAWNGNVKVNKLNEGHLPDFEKIIKESLIHKNGVSDAFTRSIDTYGSNAPAQLFAAEHLAEIIKTKEPFNGEVIEIGCGTGFLTGLIEPMLGKESSLTLIDVSPIKSDLPGKHIHSDAETFMFSLHDNSVSAIFSSSAIQWFNSPATFLHNAWRALIPGGVLAVSVYEDTTFSQIPELKSPSRIFSKQYIKSIVPQGFNLELCDSLEYVQQFDSAAELLRHFRLTGVAPLENSPESAVLARKILRSNINTLSYNPIFLLLTKKKNCNFVEYLNQ
ncbi:MAG: DUF452 family protein [Paramuribaculum sp.]|nr:DUF452 family protein [Paramuribaculum sp.]